METKIPIIDVCGTGKNINRIRLEKGFSIKDLQELLGFSTPTAIYKWIAGKSIPTIDNLVIVASVLGVRIDDLIITK